MQNGGITGSFDTSFSSVIEEIFGVRSLEKRKVYEGFYVKYNRFVAHELSKKNTFTQNYDDLFAKIWVDFSGSQSGNGGLIEKFFGQAAVSSPELPDSMTGEEAAKTFSVTFEEWLATKAFFQNRAAIWINGDLFVGASIHDLYEKVFAFLHVGSHLDSVCLPYFVSSTSYLLSTTPVHPNGRKFSHPVGDKGVYLEVTTLEALSEFLSESGFIVEADDGTGMPSFPEPIHGSSEDPTTTYLTSEINEWFDAFDCLRHLMPNMRAGAWQVRLPPPRATKKHFINYLKRCISNRYANFCRTESRKNKERVWDTFPDQTVPNWIEEAPAWEDRQESRSDQEECTEIALLVRKLNKTPAAEHIQTIILSMYDDGKTLTEALSSCPGMTKEAKQKTINVMNGACVRKLTLVGYAA